ncbi:hypothetical protein [Dysgonomonas sp. ZJ279]|uniref:hypothetical protein n=1 Tax=Dysgonomonas sp. ZJ279 TaxID=2709796 RepID=UPI0013ED9B09|nr:hypothetical protein [Dysgonomonas sp. ZJ279]
MAGVWKEVFTDVILENFYPDGSWLKELTSMDHMVSNNAINLAEVGADPDVVENNGTWPLVPVQRDDEGIRIPLSTFDTKPTHITNVEELETSYDKSRSVLMQHVNTLGERASTSAAYNIAPAKHTVKTPVLKTTGENRGDGKKRMTYNDLLRLRTAFNRAKLPTAGRILILSPEHEEDLLAADAVRYNMMLTTGSIAGFKWYTFTDTAAYDPANGEKLPKGALTGNESSLAFAKSQVMRAMGDKDARADDRWADYRGWLVGAQLRFVAMPFRAFGIASIYSDNA